jgi:Relaxase/Mobilisation nuclease domain
MFADLKFPRNFRTPLQYNEEKVSKGKAVLIGAENFLKDHDQLSMQDKIERFHQRSSLNETWTDNATHISLNFGKTEELSDQKLLIIATRYMNAMGFDNQPYLTYRHHDAGHTHLHVVATDIRSDGSKINLGPLGLQRSNQLCTEFEREFYLQENRKAAREEQAQFSVLHAHKVVYGEPGLKRAVSDVLNAVVDHYAYTSLEELNAILREYNVRANPGGEDSRLREVRGLLYHALDDNGKKIGKPLKASAFLLKPTLDRLEEKFSLNQSLREPFKDRLHTAIEWSFAGEAPDWTRFRERMEREGISIVLSRSERDSPEELYFVDHTDKYVFSAEGLGLPYGLEALRERCSLGDNRAEEETQIQSLKLSI